MTVYQYNIKTNTGNAFGTIEADDEDHAQELLTAQYAPVEHNFVDDKGNRLDIVVESLDLTEVDQ